jgi:hypothetical protein
MHKILGHKESRESLETKDQNPRLEWILQEFTLIIADVKDYDKKLLETLSAEYGVYTQNRLRLINENKNSKSKS